jgi:dihydrofolate synthase / folylpolyglutamate synthase
MSVAVERLPSKPMKKNLLDWPTTLSDWLTRCEQLHPQEIDMTLTRVRLVKERLGLSFNSPVVAVAGTNGKGSTCAMLEMVALQAGYKVGLYSKPHLVHFEERCRINGSMVSAEALIPHFEAVEHARGDISLTYFEFTLLAIARLLSETELDLVILEVGMGGRLDAVNVFDTDCAVITSIDIDHAEYLGSDRATIAVEKAGIMRFGKPVIVSDPLPPATLLAQAERVGADLRLLGRDFHFTGDKQQWSWSGRSQRFNSMAYPALRGANQLLNAAGVLAVFEALRSQIPITAQAVRNGFSLVDLPGRFQVIAGKPTLVLDVAHNPHAVAALASSLDQMGFFPRTHAVLGIMADKDLAAILTRMAPLVDHWHFADLSVTRAARAHELAALHAELTESGELKCPGSVSVSQHADPLQALNAALSGVEPTDRIVVFGSFYTVGGILKNGTPRLIGKQVT